jgi:hypothetical protein
MDLCLHEVYHDISIAQCSDEVQPFLYWTMAQSNYKYVVTRMGNTQNRWTGIDSIKGHSIHSDCERSKTTNNQTLFSLAF